VQQRHVPEEGEAVPRPYRGTVFHPPYTTITAYSPFMRALSGLPWSGAADAGEEPVING